MNRIVCFGMTTFFALIGICLIGSPQQAKGGHGLQLYGCFGCQGCHAWHAYQRCYGCYGCSGCQGCAAVVVSQCSGCGGCGCGGYQRCYGCYGRQSCAGCYACDGGCYGCHGCYGTVTAVEVVPVLAPVQSTPSASPVVTPASDPSILEAEPLFGSADVRVNLPDDAKLFVNDCATISKGAERYYRSPALMPGTAYDYEMRAEIVRDGTIVSQTKTVRVRANASSEVSFEFESPRVAQTGER